MAGAPAFFTNPNELKTKIEEYCLQSESRVEENDDGSTTTITGRPLTITGLAYFLGFESRQSFYDYEKHAEFSYIIKRARLRIECDYEERLNSKNPTGPIFALKNMGWSDRQEIDQKTQHSGGISISWKDPELPNTDDKGSD
jgi:hypothetical protein